MLNILNFGGGWKTYIVGIAIVGLAVAEGPLGIDIPGVTVGTDWVNWMLVGLGTIFMRKGIKESAPTPPTV